MKWIAITVGSVAAVAAVVATGLVLQSKPSHAKTKTGEALAATIVAKPTSDAQPSAMVAGAAMGYVYNSTPGAQIKKFIGCAENGKTTEYRCIAVVSGKNQTVCAGIDFTLTPEGALAMKQVTAVAKSTCGL